MPDRRRPIRGLAFRAYSYLYFYWWLVRAIGRSWIERGSALILSLILASLAIEVGLEVWGSEWAREPHWAIRSLFWIVILVALYTKVREWSEQRQELYFIGTAQEIVATLSRPTVPDESIRKVMAIALGAFRMKKAVRATLAQSFDGGLKITLAEPFGSAIDNNLVFPRGAGGAGYAYSEKCLVYLPRVDLGHAVVLEFDERDPYSIVEDIFIPDDVQSFESVLCVPICADGHCFGVLNFDSKKRNAFRKIDFQQAMFFAFVLADVLRRNQSAAEES